MAPLSTTIDVAATPQDAFAYVTDPTRFGECAAGRRRRSHVDRIDEIVVPGSGFFPEWNWSPPSLADPARRRRRAGG